MYHQCRLCTYPLAPTKDHSHLHHFYHCYHAFLWSVMWLEAQRSAALRLKRTGDRWKSCFCCRHQHSCLAMGSDDPSLPHTSHRGRNAMILALSELHSAGRCHLDGSASVDFGYRHFLVLPCASSQDRGKMLTRMIPKLRSRGLHEYQLWYRYRRFHSKSV